MNEQNQNSMGFGNQTGVPNQVPNFPVLNQVPVQQNQVNGSTLVNNAAQNSKLQTTYPQNISFAGQEQNMGQAPMRQPIQQNPQVQQQIVEPVKQAPNIVPQQPIMPVGSTQIQQGNVEANQQQTPIVSQNPTSISPQPEMPIQTQSTPPVIEQATPQQIVTPTVENGGIIAPSTPVESSIDATQIGFIQTGQPLKKKSNPIVKIAILLAILLGTSVIGHFIVYPLVIRMFFSDSKTVYETTIDSVSTFLQTNVNDLVKEHNIYELKASLDTDITSFSFLNNYTFSGRIGIDANEELFEIGYTITDPKKNDIGQMFYIKNNANYTRYSTYRDLLYAGAMDDAKTKELFEQFNNLSTQAERFSNEDINYIITRMKEAIKNNLIESKFSKEDASITINGTSIKVLQHKYIMDKETIETMNTSIREELAEDEKFISAVAKVKDLKENNAKSFILGKEFTYEKNGMIYTEKEKKLSIEEDFVATISIYTYGNKLDFAGLTYKDTDKNTISLYTKDGWIEIQGKTKEHSFEIEKNPSGNKSNVTVTYDDTKMADFVLNKFTKEEIDLEYNIYLNEKKESYTYSGTLSYNKNITNSDSLYKLSFELRLPDKTSLKLSGSLATDWKSDVANVNTSAAVTLNPIEINNIKSIYQNALMQTPIGYFFSTLSGFNSDSVIDYYNTIS